MFKIYLLGCLIALIIELFTMLRIRDFCFWAWMGALLGTLASWLWVIFFLSWVYDMMGWDYEYPKTDPYSMIAWRLPQNKGENNGK